MTYLDLSYRGYPIVGTMELEYHQTQTQMYSGINFYCFVELTSHFRSQMCQNWCYGHNNSPQATNHVDFEWVSRPRDVANIITNNIPIQASCSYSTRIFKSEERKKGEKGPILISLYIGFEDSGQLSA